jgi:hypothetical protein
MRRNQAINRRRRSMATCMLLGMLLLRAYVPVGFMPATGAPFLLQLCPTAAPIPTALSMDMDPHMDMSGHRAMSGQMHTTMGDGPASHRHDRADECPFGSAPAAGPLSQLHAFDTAGPVPSVAPVIFQSALHASRPDRAHPPRGPPSLV